MEMYPLIPCELIADPKGSTDHTLGTTGTEATQSLVRNILIIRSKTKKNNKAEEEQ
jgi:hypothetical protein